MEKTWFSLSDLPYEVLLVVIFQVEDDVETLDNFCIASENNIKLYEAGIAGRWQKATIDDRDLIPLHRETKSKQFEELLDHHGLKEYWKPAGHGVRKLLARARSGRCPANYVQELLFDFRMPKYHEPTFKKISRNPYEFKPTLRCLQYNLELLSQHLLRVRALKYDGDLPQKVLDELTIFSSLKGITSLTLQYRNGPTWTVQTPAKRYLKLPLSRALLSYDGLGKFTHLRSMAIHRLAHSEALSFCELLPTFLQLEILLIGDELMDWRSKADEWYYGCGIHIFLEHLVYGLEKGSKRQSRVLIRHSILPSSLKSLTLIDHHKRQELAVARSREPIAINAPLTDLNLDIDGLQYIPELGAYLKNVNLRTLSLPGSELSYLLPNYLHALISANQDTLKQIKILQAWKSSGSFAWNFHRNCQLKFVVEELVLGSVRNPQCQSPPVFISNPWCILDWYLDASRGDFPIDGCPRQWGDRLKRIRIDDIPFPVLDVRILAETRFEDLKILMLQPFDDGKIPEIPVWHYHRIDQPTAWELANDIRQQASSSLRVIVLQDYWFWISESGSLWSWSAAGRDDQEALKMRRLLSDVDRAFLRNTVPPFWNARFRSEPEKFEPWSDVHHAERDSLAWNYMVAYPTETARL